MDRPQAPGIITERLRPVRDGANVLELLKIISASQNNCATREEPEQPLV
jgi:hypothetical protein